MSTALRGSVLKLLNVYFNANPIPDSTFHFKAFPAPDPASKNNADPIRIRNPAYSLPPPSPTVFEKAKGTQRLGDDEYEVLLSLCETVHCTVYSVRYR